MSILNPEINTFLAEIVYLVKVLSKHKSNFEPKKPWKYKQL